ncbi:phosphatidylserine/phosphatidylglycerophosphate/cardiolipin synthase family protein [Nonomuraea sp. NPDC050790]|uniref:phosphatidylserine/phosphatidylglycerophosphate/ cardiolipin synthase family protein n=1 Tax=Nonomuraea sp. NPDC050790 TaxID=3364371 RepID=UPI0037973B19
MTDSQAATIELGARIVPGGFFLTRKDAPARTPFAPRPCDGEPPYRHCFTYAGGGSDIRHELIRMIDGAQRKIFVATLFLGDAELREALIRAARRLRGGVYVVSALDDKGLDKAINNVDDKTDIDQQLEYRNFRELTRHGIYVRGCAGLHAKFVVVDDATALVSSANLVTRSFDRVGENGVVVTEAEDVIRLAKLFGRLWQLSAWDMPPDPDPERHRVESRTARSLITVDAPAKGTGPIWTWGGDEHHIAAAIVDIVDRAEKDLILATFSVANMTYQIGRHPPEPRLLFDPVRRAVERGVRVRMFMRGRNNMDAARAEAAAFAGAGVEIVPDRLNHAKAAIADDRHGALFSANFLTGLGLTGGIEMGMRLDGTAALAEAVRYYEHAMAEANMTFAHDPSLEELAGALYAEALTPWPLPPSLEVVADDRTWRRLQEQQGVVLYERSGASPVTLRSGEERWQLDTANGWWWLEPCASPGQGRGAGETFEAWLTRERTPEGVERGLCAAALVRTSP